MTALIAKRLPPKVEPWVPGGHALTRFASRKTRADREAAAERLGERHDVGRDADALIGEQFAGAAHAALHFVEDQHQAVLVAQRAQRSEERRLDDAHAAFAHQRLDQDRGGLGPDGALDRFQIAERHMIEAVDLRAKTVEIFLLAGGGERRQRAAVEGTLECDDAIALGLAARRLVFARHLDRAFHRLGAGIAEECVVGKACLAQPFCGALALRNLVEIGDVPDFSGLLLQRGDELRVRVPQRIDGDARAKIEIALAVGRDQPYAFAPLESEVDAREGWHQMRCHG